MLITVFGGITVAGVPANLLAALAAVPVMVFGLGAGVVAGLIGGVAAAALHWPTHLLISWIAWVAHSAASLPLGEIRERELGVLAIGAAVVAAAHHVGFVGVRRAGLVLVASAIVAPAMTLRAPAPLRVALTTGATLWRADAAVLDIDGRVDASRLLEALRRAGVACLELVVARTSTVSMSAALDGLRRRQPIGDVLTPETVHGATSLTVGQLLVDVGRSGDRLTVEITAQPVGRARPPPCLTNACAASGRHKGRLPGHPGMRLERRLLQSVATASHPT